VTPLMNVPQPFQILKMDRRRGNIVVSRRTVLEETRAEQRQELVQNLEEGQVIDGVVKNITDYGAFVDLGGIDGLLHVTDIAWRRVNHPTEVLNIGQQVKVKIIKINHETHRISLGMKQLLDDPWQGIEAKFPVNAKLRGRVTNITDYGAFVELEPGIEGLIHVSEMSWTKKNVHPGKIVSTSQEVECSARGRSGQAAHFARPEADHAQPVGAVRREVSGRLGLEGEVKNKTEFGLFLGLDGDVDGMVHLSDLDWKRPGEQVIDEYKKGDKVRAQVLDVDVEKERISLGIKQLEADPFAEPGDLKRNAVVTTEVIEVKDSGIDVKIVGTEFTAFIKRSDLARDRSEQRPERFRGRPEGRRARDAVRQEGAQGRRLDQGAGSGRGEGGDRPVRLLRLGCDARRHPRHRAEEARRGSGREVRSLRLTLSPPLHGERVPKTEGPESGEGNRAASGYRLNTHCHFIRHNCGAFLRAIDHDNPGRHFRRDPCGRFAMSLDADLIVDRRRMRRKLTFWRVVAVADRDRRGGRARRDGATRKCAHRGRRLHRAESRCPA
jgi:predicted RNA-binding protein with RPS1 domain